MADDDMPSAAEVLAEAVAALRTGKEAIVFHLAGPDNVIAKTTFQLTGEDNVSVYTDMIDGTGCGMTEPIIEAAARLLKLLVYYHSCFPPSAVFDDLLTNEKKKGVMVMWDFDEFPIDWNGVQTHTIFVDGDVDPEELAKAESALRERDAKARATNAATVEALVRAAAQWREGMPWVLSDDDIDQALTAAAP